MIPGYEPMLRPGIREYFRLRPRSPERLTEQVNDEIALHIDLRTQELIARGVDPVTARAEAERRFGGIERARLTLQRSAEHRERRKSLMEWLAGWRQDFRYSARALGREPLLALVIVLTLALGIGANATMFGIVDHLLLRGPAHVQAPDELRRVHIAPEPGSNPNAFTGYIAYTTLRDHTSAFAAVAAFRTGDARLGRGEHARDIPAGWSTPDMFPLLGVQPALGRFYTEEEDRPRAAARVAVLDHGFWQAEFGGARDVLGRSVTVDGDDFTVIGVAPRGFTGPQLQPVSVWLPFSTGYEPHPEWPTTWNAKWLHVVVRVDPTVPEERAVAEATAAYRAAAGDEAPHEATAALSLLPPTFSAAGNEPPELAVSRWLAGVSLIVLLVACANVANLLLARGVRRRRELSVRLALGVSRARLTRLLLSESLLLAAAGGALAIAIAYWGGHLLRLALLPGIQWGSPLDGRVLLFSGGVVLLTGLAIGLAPALQARDHELTSTLKATGGGGSARRGRLPGALTVLQSALSLVLLVGAALFVQSLWKVERLDVGIDARHVLAVWTSFEGSGDMTVAQLLAERANRATLLQHAVERLRANPDVAGAALALGTPLQGSFGVPLRVPGLDSLPSLPGGNPSISAVSPGYFETVGTRIVRGRGIVAGEGEGSEAVVVVNEAMAGALWPGEDALTKCVYIGAGADVPCARVVGIAANTKRHSLHDEPAMQYYIPFGQERGIGGTQIIVRPRGDAIQYMPTLRRELHAAIPGADYFTINLLQQRLDPQIRPWRLGATMFLVFGGLALVIAAVGLYSVIAYGVTRRRREIGVRMALGARRGSIIRLVMREGTALVLLGVALGVPAALALSGWVEELLFETSARGAGTYLAVSGLLVGIALLASLVPATRAGGTQPSEALRPD